MGKAEVDRRRGEWGQGQGGAARATPVGNQKAPGFAEADTRNPCRFPVHIFNVCNREPLTTYCKMSMDAYNLSHRIARPYTTCTLDRMPDMNLMKELTPRRMCHDFQQSHYRINHLLNGVCWSQWGLLVALHATHIIPMEF